METSEFEARFRTAQIIWVALMAGVGAFAVVAFTLIAVLGQSFGTLEPQVLYVAAPVLVVMMFAGPVTGRRLEERIPRELAPSERLQRYQAARIVALALCEGPGLLAIVLALLSDQASWALAGGAASIWFMILARPRREDAERLVRR